MRISKLLLFIWACLFSLGMTTPAAMNTKDAKNHRYARSEPQLFQPSRLFVAQDNSDDQQPGESGPNLENRSKPHTEKETKPKAPSSKAKTGSLPSYEPSEKIEADQAVDFPYDI